MYRIHLQKGKNKYEFEELVKVFLKTGEYRFEGLSDHNEGLSDQEETELTDAAAGEAELDGTDCIDIYVPEFPEHPEWNKKEKDTKK